VDRQDHLENRSDYASTVSAEETEYGVRTVVTTPGRPTSVLHFHMPNTNQLGSETEAVVPTNSNDARSPWGDRMFFRVPVDDTHCVSYLVGILNLPDDPQVAERRRRAAQAVSVSPNDAAEAVLAGEFSLEEAPQEFNQREMFWVEDYITEVGQGAIAPRTEDHLGRRDTGVALLRSIWRRELQALAEGHPLKAWTTPAGLLSMPLATPSPSGRG
jgi:5,5'-dehydrodivanillate O-demethylase